MRSHLAPTWLLTHSFQRQRILSKMIPKFKLWLNSLTREEKIGSRIRKSGAGAWPNFSDFLFSWALGTLWASFIPYNLRTILRWVSASQTRLEICMYIPELGPFQSWAIWKARRGWGWEEGPRAGSLPHLTPQRETQQWISSVKKISEWGTGPGALLS